MRRVANDRKVLFVNSIGMRIPIPGRSSQSGRRVLRKVRSVLRFVQHPLPDTPDFAVVTPLILPFYGSKVMRAVNARLVRTQVRLFARMLRIDVHRSVAFVTIPTAWEVVRGLRFAQLVFNRSDLHSAFEETDQSYIRYLEQQLLEHADAVVYVSHSLQAVEKPTVRGRSVFLDHGVDLDHFGHVADEVPSDIAAIPHPRIGFFGGIDEYVVDLGLLERVAREIPDAHLVLIGDATCDMGDLTTHPNVHWLGFRPYEQIPAYGQAFDVALMPWLRNEWIEHSNPIKLKEYLALGLPIVSTDFPEVHFYGEVVAVARDPEEFVAHVRSALDGAAVGTADARRARVADATWQSRAHELLELGEGGS
jgi:glycosyltransferase involved in cell wall biosynthesis